MGGKSIGGSAGRAVEIKEFRVLPGIDTHRADADRNVALNGYSTGARIAAGVEQLAVEVELQPGIEQKIAVAVFDCQLRYQSGRIGFAATGIAQNRKRTIGEQPLGIGGHELAKLARRGFGCTVHLIYIARVGLLQGNHGGIIDIGHRIEPLALPVEALARLRVGQLAEQLRAQIERMEGKGADGAIGI